MRGFDYYCKRGSPRGELAPARATERGQQFLSIRIKLD